MVKMKINKSVTYSSIVGIGEKIKKVEKETGTKFLTTQRGINDVINIDLSDIINKIDFNSKEAQQYTPNLGILSFRQNTGKLYFPSIENIESCICITCGGMKSIDLSLQILNMEKVFSFYWYKNLILICYDCNQTDDFTIAIPASDENTCILNNFLRRVNK